MHRPGAYKLHAACIVGFSSKKVKQLECHRQQHEEFLRNRPNFCSISAAAPMQFRGPSRKSRKKHRASHTDKYDNDRSKVATIGVGEIKSGNESTGVCASQDIRDHVSELKVLTHDFTDIPDNTKEAVSATMKRLAMAIENHIPSEHVKAKKQVLNTHVWPEICFWLVAIAAVS